MKVRIFADWHEPPPGSMEIDLVAHCGDMNRGSYVHSLIICARTARAVWSCCSVQSL